MAVRLSQSSWMGWRAEADDLTKSQQAVQLRPSRYLLVAACQAGSQDRGKHTVLVLVSAAGTAA
jgi:hypothetical protein